MTTLADRLATLRRARGLSVSELARISGVSRDHIYRIERGERDKPGGDVLSALVAALATSSDYLLGLTDNYGYGEGERITIPTPDLAPFVARLNALPPRQRARAVAAFSMLLDVLAPVPATTPGRSYEQAVEIFGALSPEQQYAFFRHLQQQLAATG